MWNEEELIKISKFIRVLKQDKTNNKYINIREILSDEYLEKDKNFSIKYL